MKKVTNVLVLACGFLALQAQAPNFHLTEIRFEGMRHDAEGILLSESRLTVDQSYSEADLLQAMIRLRRLPFILDAEFRLEKGPRIQTYTLVIHIRETRRLFMDTQTAFYQTSGSENLSLNQASLGLRWFPTSKSQVYSAVSPSIQIFGSDLKLPLRLTMGFAQYDLGGPGRFFNVEGFWSSLNDTITTINQTEFNIDNRTSGLDFFYAVPIKKTQWLRFGGGIRQGESDGFRHYLPEIGSNFQTTRQLVDSSLLYVSTDWERNTTNDNAMPTKGFRVRAGLGVLRLENEFNVPDLFDETFQNDRDEAVSFLVYDHYWNFHRRQSFFLNVVGRLAFEKFDRDRPLVVFSNPPRRVTGTDTDFRLGVASGYILNLLGPESTNRVGNLHLELEVNNSFDRENFDPISGTQVNEIDNGVTNFEARLVFRNAWGIYRVGVFHGWD